MLVADVSENYTDLVTTVFSSTIAAKAWLATAAVLLALVQVTTAARMGRGVMPAGIVSGQEQADVVAYVVAVSSQSQ